MSDPVQCSEPPARSINSSHVGRAMHFANSPDLRREGAVMIIPSQAGSASAGITSSPDAMVYVVENDVMKDGIAGVFTSTLEPGRKDHIANCTAGGKMTQCLGTELGLDVINSTLNMSPQELDRRILEIGQKQHNHPIGYNKAILYLFCHGNAHSVKLADVFVERQYIVKKFQSQFPSEVIKIIMFECCRLESSPTCVAIEEENQDTTKSKVFSLWVEGNSNGNGQYEVTDNMIVIEATSYNNMAHYICGCGFFTDQFADLAPKENVSLSDLLIKVRKGVSDKVQTHGKYQVVEYKDRLFDVVNLLVDSRGTARIPATDVSANSSLVETTVTWVIDERVKDQVDHCYVKVMSDGDTAKRSRPTNSRIASFSGLRPNADHIAKVVTVYKGGHEVSSIACHFTTKGRVCATHVSTTSTLLKTAVTWAIDERIEDQIDHCYVEVVSNGETVKRSKSINSRMVSFSGLRPNADHTANVAIVYKDGGTAVSEDHHFRTKDIRKIYWAIFGLIVLGVISFLAVLSYTPYLYFSQLDNNDATYFISKDGTIQCGFGRSNEHRGINLKGLQKSDTSQGSISAQVIRNDALKLYSEQVGPIYGGYPLYPGVHHATLPGWNNYLWERSVISGDCCVKNGNDSEATASLHLFTSDEDREQYLKGEPAEHYVLTQTINLPPTTSVCFTEWGKNKSYLVKKRAYHFFVLAVSRDNMSFDSQIRLTRKYVNISDYGNPHYFEYNTQTYFEFPNNYRHPTDFIAICHAPVSIKVFHIQSWNSPILPKLPFVLALSFGSIGLFSACIGLVFICYHTFSVIKHLCTRHQTVVNIYRHI